MIKLILTAALAVSLSAGAAFAQAVAPTIAPAAGALAPHAPMPKSGNGRPTARSVHCSKKADTVNVHGKPRAIYMRKCMNG